MTSAASMSIHSLKSLDMSGPSYVGERPTKKLPSGKIHLPDDVTDEGRCLRGRVAAASSMPTRYNKGHND